MAWDYTNEEIKTEAEAWFKSYAGNFARFFLDRTAENAYKTWVVFADLALGIHFEDGTDENIETFEQLFLNSSKDLNVSIHEVAEGMKEYDEILELVY